MGLSSLRRLPRRFSIAVLGLSLYSLSFLHDVPETWAQTSQAATEPKRPAYQLGSAGRYNEDWSSLRGVDLSATDDPLDRLKFIPLSPDQNVWLTIGGQVRERGEYFRQFQFGNSEPKQSDGYLLSRYRLIADLHVTRYVRMFAEGKSSLALDRELAGGRTTGFVDEFDLLNGFADIMIPLGEQASVTLRGGREELIFGSQRLVGVFGTGPLYVLPLNLDLYWLDADNRTATFNGTTGHERRHTLGGRVWGKVGTTGLDFEVEGATQFATVGRGDIGAWMATALLGYTLPVPQLSPRIYVEFDYASGDDKPGRNVGTFNQLYPNAHSYLGYIDYIGRQNIISTSGGASISPIHDLTLSLQHYFFWRASDRDAIYNKSGGVLRPGTTTSARYVGAETDVYATYKLHASSSGLWGL